LLLLSSSSSYALEHVIEQNLKNCLIISTFNLRKKKRKWVHDINLQRHVSGEYQTLMEQLRRDERRFYIYFWKTTDKFDEVLSMIKDDTRKMDTNYREAISPDEHLAIALRYEQNQCLFLTITVFFFITA
jgi:hypothetical protein